MSNPKTLLVLVVGIIIGIIIIINVARSNNQNVDEITIGMEGVSLKFSNQVPAVEAIPEPKSQPDTQEDENNDGRVDKQSWNYDMNGDGRVDQIDYDRNLNGVIDLVMMIDTNYPGGKIYSFDDDEDGIYDYWGFDYNSNEHIETLAWDRDYNNVFDEWAVDDNEDGQLDQRIFDVNEDGVSD
jgi:hypothetical protein